MALPNISDLPNTLTILEDGELNKNVTNNYLLHYIIKYFRFVNTFH